MKSQNKILWLFFAFVVFLFFLGGLYFYFVMNSTSGTRLVVSGMVVPHHNLVAEQRAELFSEVSKKITPPKTIILLSPNHYSAGRGAIQMTNKNWELGQGQITADQKVFSFLVKNKLATDESSSFIYEHGIYNILEDIHNNFPGARIVPIIFGNVSQKDLEKLEWGLKDSCKDCFMIASVDFSHYNLASIARLQDERSIGALKTLNTNDIFMNAKVDSPPALALLNMWAKDHSTAEFVFKNRTDSGISIGNPDNEGTTHVFGWYQK